MDTIDSVRDFNRFYTRKIGLVGRDYVSGNLSLSELRVLYELGQQDPPTARVLANDLDLDEGYLSRILAKFSKNGWLVRKPDPIDRRKSVLKLSAAGQQQSDAYVDEARRKIGQVISHTDTIDQNRIVKAMATVRALLTGEVSPVKLRDLQAGDGGWLIQKHAEIYQREYGFDESFEALVADILADFIRNRQNSEQCAFIAERDGQRLGSVFCVRQSAEVAKLRLFLLVPQARGLGIGKQLLEVCLGFAREQGYQRMVLWTMKDLDAACALYARYGFRITATEKIRQFGVDVVNLSYEVEL